MRSDDVETGARQFYREKFTRYARFIPMSFFIYARFIPMSFGR
ncbi:hypothetical protein LTSERUB_5858 [Salmonella enterica subsp. enterica serovar Rubislaw str. A4-653]|uniref:Uncharacterized protein n=1 Tax=Salmonella enterica subsp. enterica serovar Rubislaw str. A4-653 TaxID=913081 RepID=G5QRR8_SALRU|nr:hypothetical protein LTSERUB_5858 [Salmonella enterica subsp. enterica serovar Rubislaw str. A4-653]